MKKSIIAGSAILACLLAAAGFRSHLKGAPVSKHVRFLHVADMHAQLDTHWEYLPEDPKNLHRMGGFARIRTALDQERAGAPGAVFTLDGGDTFQGSAAAAWTQEEAVGGPPPPFFIPPPNPPPLLTSP